MRHKDRMKQMYMGEAVGTHSSTAGAVTELITNTRLAMPELNPRNREIARLKRVELFTALVTSGASYEFSYAFSLYRQVNRTGFAAGQGQANSLQWRWHTRDSDSFGSFSDRLLTQPEPMMMWPDGLEPIFAEEDPQGSLVSVWSPIINPGTLQWVWRLYYWYTIEVPTEEEYEAIVRAYGRLA